MDEFCECGHPKNDHEDGIGICEDCYCNAFRAEVK